MADYSRRRIWAEATSLYNFDGISLSEAASNLESLRNEYGDCARIEKMQYDYSDGHYWAVMVERDETDQEMQTRIAREEQWDKERNERELREFERLKAKFGG